MDIGQPLVFEAGITPAQREARKGRFGSSQAAALLGVDKYTGHRALYERFVNPTEIVPNERMIHGKFQEPSTIAIYAALHHRKVWAPGSCFLDGHPLFIDHVDGLSGGLDDDRPDRCIEAKDVMGIFRDQYGKEWTNQVPVDKIPQCIFHCGFWNLPVCDLPVMLGGVLRVYQIEFDQDIFDAIIEAGESLYNNHILPRIPPPMDGKKSTTEMMAYVAHKTENMRPATASESAVIGSLQHARERIKYYKEQEAELKNKLCDAIGEDAGLDGCGVKVTWKKGKDVTKIDWRGLAESYEPDLKRIDTFTETVAGSRRFTIRDY
jgi:hypothetical protein